MVEKDTEAVSLMHQKRFAKTTVGSMKVRAKWWQDRCGARGWAVASVSPARLEIAGALLTRGQYRSIESYISAIKRAHVSAQGVWTDLHMQVASDAIRAGCRGKGPGRQAAPLPLEELIDKMAEHRLHAHEHWPEEPASVLVVVCAWLVREIESSSAMVEHVCVHEPQDGQAGCRWAEWKLPATKTDTAAQGTTRSLGCACPSRLCPVAS